MDDPQDDQTDSTHQDVVDPDDAKHEDAKPPSVKGETDTMSGDMPEGPADIDEEMAKIGEEIDPEHPTPLGEG